MAITTRKSDFSARYNELVDQANLAQHSAVRGCMVIKPYGYAIWENMQKILDNMFKATWHSNAYFPLFIPKSFFSKEAKHVEWFATEAAIVTHYRLKKDEVSGEMIVDPDAKLDEELIVRPTSETIIWNTYRDRVQSYRDLPILVNQRANVVRWEMRTRLFLRTAEFLRQEWHTAHASEAEAIEETKKMWNVYNDFFENVLALSWVMGEKSESERFAGAENTYCIEAMMQDGKALQIATSHYLGQNFWKAFDVQFLNKNNEKEYAYATSRWVSTRAMGWLIMSHSDDKWLVLPPAVAPIHVVIVPFFKTEEDLNSISTYIADLQNIINNKEFTINLKTKIFKREIITKFDIDDAKSPGWKFNEYELQWVPIRLTIGKKEMEQWLIEIYRRDTGTKELIKIENCADKVMDTLYDIQDTLFTNNKKMRESNTVYVNTYEEFQQALDDGKFIMAHRDGTAETESLIKEECKAVTRCIPTDSPLEDGVCIRTGKPSKRRVLFARSY
jgi:prolyl-tRNA synthetase